MSWLRTAFHSSSKSKGKERVHDYPSDAPPSWNPSPHDEAIRPEGRYADATDKDYKSAEDFCLKHPLAPSRLLPSEAIERIRAQGSGAWELELPSVAEGRSFKGTIHNGHKSGVIRVASKYDCSDSCIFSNLPILAGLYDTRGKEGVYYEVKMLRVPPQPGSIAIGE